MMRNGIEYHEQGKPTNISLSTFGAAYAAHEHKSTSNHAHHVCIVMHDIIRYYYRAEQPNHRTESNIRAKHVYSKGSHLLPNRHCVSSFFEERCQAPGVQVRKSVLGRKISRSKTVF
eukprot:7486611-Pyramimonas_sp.AAC.1